MLIFKEAVVCYTLDDIKSSLNFKEVEWKMRRKLPRLIECGNISENYIITNIRDSIFNYLISKGYFVDFHDNYWCN